MSAILTQNNKALFDPGFAPNIISFLPIAQATQSELAKLKTFAQQQIRFKILHKNCVRALESTLGFWVGNILWFGYLKYKFKNAPQAIIGNRFLDNEQENPEKIYNFEFLVMEKYIETYSQNVYYFTGQRELLPSSYGRILQRYKKFVEDNNYFLQTQSTKDIQLPLALGSFDHCSEEQLERIHYRINHLITKGDLSEFLTSDFIKVLLGG